MLKRLRIKFVCINMTIVTAMLCVIFGMILHFTKDNLEIQSIQMMHTIATTSVKPGRPNDHSPETKLPFFTLQTGQKNELISTGGGFYDLSDDIFLQELIDITSASDEHIGTIDEYNLRYLRIDTPFGKNLVFADMTSEINTVNSLIKSCLLIGFLSFLAFLVISLLLARWAVKPVDKAWTQQKQFVADASHELKTPLTVIMTNAEMLQVPECNKADKEKFSSSILTMSHQMRGLVESLLELARIDNNSIKIALAPIDFSRLVYEAILPFEAVFFEKELTLNTIITDNIKINASESHIRQLIEIFLDNAQKYSFTGTDVTLSLKRIGKKHCKLSVNNVGEPISKEDLKNIFKRFYRVDKARSMNHSYGLGLSIAEGIAHNHHGKIWAESANGINTFSVQFPIL
ncbi:MAG: HAMP domain-containing histidine kinase [Lachnospiraceae bacterium]|nr:HAMP domain-containing histidine kinase [Lachnospiraceae bacterium]